jgi:hypothetical protein
MKISSNKLLRGLLVLAAVLARPASLLGQESASRAASQKQADAVRTVQVAALDPLPETPAPSPSLRPVSAAAMPPMAIVATTMLPAVSERHRFWDRENTILFTASGAMATADFFVTRANLANGGRELNPITRVMAGSTPALAANFAIETGSFICVSYLFHKTGHHQLERVTSFVSIGGSSGAVVYGLTHR